MKVTFLFTLLFVATVCATGVTSDMDKKKAEAPPSFHSWFLRSFYSNHEIIERDPIAIAPLSSTTTSTSTTSTSSSFADHRKVLSKPPPHQGPPPVGSIPFEQQGQFLN